MTAITRPPAARSAGPSARRPAGRAASPVILALLLAALLWPAAARGWSFGVCGDSRDDVHGIFPRILSLVEDSDMEFLLHTGDLESRGNAEAWEAFREKTRAFSKPLYIAVGNHELQKDGATRKYGTEAFARFFGLPATSFFFTHKDAYVAVIDNAGGDFADDDLDRLDKALSEHPKGKNGIRYLIVAMHIPPPTDNIAPHRIGKKFREQSRRLHGILVRCGADLLLASHEHMHLIDDWNGVKVIVSGGAGAPMFPFQRYGFYRIDLSDGVVRETFIPVSGSR